MGEGQNMQMFEKSKIAKMMKIKALAFLTSLKI